MTGPDREPPDGRTALAVVATTAEVLDRPDLDEGLLAPWERRRLARVRVPSRRDDVLAARLLLRLCAARFTGRQPHELLPAQFCAACERYGHGRPYLRGHPDVGVSLSHADGLVAAAAGPGAVGVDVEPAARTVGPPPMLARLMSEAQLRAVGALPDPDRAVLRMWVRREALLKAGHPGAGSAADVPHTVPDSGSRAGRPGGLHVLDWTDERRAAVATVASAVPARRFSVTPTPSALRETM
ncbi:4-phosphopantetheinyl transferase [Streptomyces sp. WZ.A104]|uniref:4'-phosphopantetheinyl transferase superfamily protein n=1 Tax=Streptomyces sp. WZ.A104 TaxID=2023771 RepID=UPI000BBC4F80|nr:4'-phosphopantetheinyl transferase superfamily protein [Streptomyces sp. WZ.A104]PCG82582.1 4-phosphopantetheinyl transferase [Streptomyces sp. WZ.A104]